MSRYVMVLNDGETYTDLDRCAIVEVPPDTPDEEVDSLVTNRYRRKVTVTTFGSPS